MAVRSVENSRRWSQDEFNLFIKENDVVGFFAEKVKLASGRESNFYVNWRKVVGDAYLLDKLTDFLIAFIKDEGLKPGTVYGVPEGATPIGLVTQFKLAKMHIEFGKGSHALAMGRGKPKEHGLPKDRFSVGAEPKPPVVVVEDVTTTGGLVIKTVKGLQEAGIKVVAIISLTNRNEKTDDGKPAEEAIEEETGVDYFAMSDAFELLPMLIADKKPDAKIVSALVSEFDEHGVIRLGPLLRQNA